MATPRVALVTGANRGIGLETSRQLLAKGLTVILAGRDEAALEREDGDCWRSDEGSNDQRHCPGEKQSHARRHELGAEDWRGHEAGADADEDPDVLG